MANFKSKKPKIDLSRPSISIQSTNRVWQTVLVGSLEPGDVVADFGVVVRSPQPTCNGQVLLEVGLPESRELFFDAKDELYAFTRKENNWPVTP